MSNFLDYPTSLLRGLSNSEALIDGVYIAPAAFVPDNYDASRGDSFRELSINWEDDEGAVATLLNQQKGDGSIQFKVGYCRILTEELKRTMDTYISNKDFGFERRPISDSEGTITNPYHGNLLIKEGLNKRVVTMIEGALAIIAQKGLVRRG